MKKKIPFLLLLSFPVLAAPLKVEDVLQSTRTHFPAIIQAKEGVAEAEGHLKNAEGAYDMKLKGNNFWVTTGYYKRHLTEVVLVKSLPTLGSSVYTSYGKAYPNFFPPQYSTWSTNSGGQAMVGGEINLLRNSMLDQNRANIKSGELGLNKAKQDLEWQKLQVGKAGVLHYWQWLAQMRIHHIYNNLLDMAVKRDDILAQRVQRGDTSEIVRKENQQYMSRRKAELASVDMELKRNSLDLSLFLRNDQGMMQVPEMQSSEEVMNILENEEKKARAEIGKFNHEGLATRLVENRPDFQSLKFDIEKNEVEYRMGENDIMPALIVGTDYTRYMGNEDPTNAAHIVQLNLKFEIPLEWELGLGRKQAAGAQRRILNSQFNFMKETVKNEIEKFQETLKLSQEKVENTRTEVKFARDLLDAEYIRFKNGNSNLFLVNIREENLIAAEENETHAIAEMLQIYTEFKMATMQL